MEDKNDNMLVIDVRSLLVRGVQKEQKDNAEKSFARNIYSQASQLIQAIVDYDASVPADSLVSRSERHNVIAFTGRRGTGKTSAMVSFANLLQEPDFLKKHRIERARFYALHNHIDASMLTKKKDNLLRSVLSEMYLDMKKKHEHCPEYRDEAHFRNLRTQFVRILQDYNAVTQSSNERNNAENELEAQTDRLYIKSCMEKLVREYLSCMLRTDCRDETANTYLVICIDDIDMAKGIQSNIVNEIFLYLMIPRVIVLFTADFRNLKLALQKDFYDSLEFGKEENEEILIAGDKQARNYLQKIVPSDMRITMPSWKKVDYRELYPVFIDAKHYRDLKRLSGCFSIPPERIKPKEFILFLLAKRTDCLLDLGGHKLHFMEPESLRDLYDKFYLLYNMESLSVEDTELRAARLKNNQKILLDYLYFKMQPELKLSSQENAFVEDLLSLPLERRGKRIWEYYFSCLQNPTTRDRIMNRFSRDFYIKERSLEKDRYFCMGEVFRVLFTASRIGVFGKDFVKLLLASYSFTMPQYIESLERELAKKALDLESINELTRKNGMCMTRLQEMFGDSLLGQWVGVGVKKELFISFPLDISSELGWRAICLLTLLGTNLCGEENRRSNPSVIIDFSNETISIFRSDITAVPINLMKMKTLRVQFGAVFNKKTYIMDIDDVDDFKKSNKEYQELEKKIQSGSMPENPRLNYLNWLEQFNSSFNSLIGEMQREHVTLSFMLKHIDMTYNILKRAMIKTYYYSADNPSVYKVPQPNDAANYFNVFISRLKELYEDQLKAYYGEKDIVETEFASDFKLIGDIIDSIDKLGANSKAKWEWKDYPKNVPPAASEGTKKGAKK